LAMRETARALLLPSVADTGGAYRVSVEVIDPISNADATAAALGRVRFFTRMQRGDVSTTFPAAKPAAQQMIDDLVAPGRS